MVLSRIVLRLGGAVWVALSVAAFLLVLAGFLAKEPAAFALALAMGMQNSAANRFNGVALNTVFVTGNIQKIGEGLIAWAWPSRDPAHKSDGVMIFALVWFGYAVGAGLGAVAHMTLTYPLLVPAALLPFVMLSSGDLPGWLARRTG